MIICISCCVVNTVMSHEFNCMCCFEVTTSEVGTTIEFYIALLIMVRSGNIIVIVALLYGMHHIVSVC